MKSVMMNKDDIALNALENLQKIKAIELYRELVDEQPQNLGYLRGLALALSWSGNSTESEKIADQMVTLSPTAIETLEVLAYIKVRQRKFAEAETIAQEAYQLAPNDPRVLMICGLSTSMLGNKLTGLSYYQHALEIDPDNTRLLYILCFLALQIGRGDVAYSVLKKRFEKNKNLRIAFYLSLVPILDQSKKGKLFRIGMGILLYLFGLGYILSKVSLFLYFPLLILVWVFWGCLSTVFDPLFEKSKSILFTLLSFLGIYWLLTLIF